MEISISLEQKIKESLRNKLEKVFLTQNSFINKTIIKEGETDEDPNCPTKKGYVNIIDRQRLPGYCVVTTPKGGMVYIPTGSTLILKDLDATQPKNYPSIYPWVDKAKGGLGNSITNLWVPQDLSFMIVDNATIGFTQPDGKKYLASYRNTKLDEDVKTNNIDTWGKFYQLYESKKITPSPESWTFTNYYTKEGTPYKDKEVPKDDRGWLEIAWDWCVENWVFLTQIAISIIAGILTGGLSLMTQALIQLAIDIAFAIPTLLEGDSIGFFINVAIGLVPVIGRASKFGVKEVNAFLKNYGPELSKLKTKDEIGAFIKGLKATNAEAAELLLRAVQQTPGELKNALGQVMGKEFIRQVAADPKILGKIPFKKRLWWKMTLVEPGVSIAIAVPAKILYALDKEGEELEKTIKTIDKAKYQPSKKTQFTSDSLKVVEFLPKDDGKIKVNRKKDFNANLYNELDENDPDYFEKLAAADIEGIQSIDTLKTSNQTDPLETPKSTTENK